MAGFYKGGFFKSQTEAMQEMASADTRRAAAAEEFNAQFRERTQSDRQRNSQQPHHTDPNQAAIDIESHVNS